MENKGFTLIELLLVIIILGLLMFFLIPKFSQVTLNSKIDSVEADLRVFSLDLNNYLVDYGAFTVNPNSEDFEEDVRDFVDILNSSYLTYSLDYNSINFADDNKSFYVETDIKNDPWNSKYRLYVNSDPVAGGGLMVVVSSGPNMEFDIKKEDSEKEGVFGDDILVIIEPK